MKNKINLYSALIILSISLLTFVGFGYFDLISDNFFKIDDVGSHFYPFYLVNSFIGFLVYYIGPWIIIPAVVNLIVIFKRFHKPHFTFFIFFQLFCLVFFLLFCFFTGEFFIGKGLASRLKEIDLKYLIAIKIILLFSLCWFLDKNKSLQNYIINNYEYRFDLYHNMKKFNFLSNKQNVINIIRQYIN